MQPRSEAISLTSMKRDVNTEALVSRCSGFALFGPAFKNSPDEGPFGKRAVAIRECNQALLLPRIHRFLPLCGD